MKPLVLPRPSLGFIVRAVAAIAVAVAVVVLWRSGLLDILKPDRLAETRTWARARFEASPAPVLAGYVVLYGVLTGLALPVAAALTLLAGAIFGALLGGTVISVASTVAAVIGYWLARSVLLGLTPQGARKSPAVARFVRLVKKDAFLVVLSARLMPLLPFNAVNLAAGLSSVPLTAYVSGTVLGVIPTSFIFATLGSGLGDSLEDRASFWAAAKSPGVWGPLLALAVLSSVATVVKLRRREA